MEVLRKDEDDWWFAKHSDGRTGSIPVPYVQVVSIHFHSCALLQYSLPFLCLTLSIHFHSIPLPYVKYSLSFHSFALR